MFNYKDLVKDLKLEFEQHPLNNNTDKSKGFHEAVKIFNSLLIESKYKDDWKSPAIKPKSGESIVIRFICEENDVVYDVIGRYTDDNWYVIPGLGYKYELKPLSGVSIIGWKNYL